MPSSPERVIVFVHERQDLTDQEHFTLTGVSPFIGHAETFSSTGSITDYAMAGSVRDDYERMFSHQLQELVLAHCSDAQRFIVLVHGTKSYYRTIDIEMIRILSEDQAQGFSLEDVTVVTLRGLILNSEALHSLPLQLHALDF